MLSILIPVYNFDIHALVTALRKELVSLDMVYEICCLDDASTDKVLTEKNMEINAWMHCSYSLHAENLGRSKTRNALIKKAAYQQLLFLDCDVMPVRPNFISSYLEALQTQSVVYGGLSYPDNEQIKSSLHQRYGLHREAQSVKQRSKAGKISFSTANFAIQRSCLSKVSFDERISGYGFEDLVFAKALVANHWQIAHIDNPVTHLGVEDENRKFLEKEQESLQTLKSLLDEKILNANDVKLLAYHRRLVKLGLAPVYRAFYRTFKLNFKRNLQSGKPSLFIFDLYRLGYFLELKN